MLRRLFRWLILIVFLLLVGVFSWYKLQPGEIEVVVAPVARGTVEKVAANTRAGTLKACRQADLSPSVGGQIKVLAVHKGDTVQAGQLLLELWNEDLKAEAELAMREVAASEAQVTVSRLQAEISSREAERLQPLWRSGAVSAEAADKASTEAKVRRAASAAAQAAVLSSRARLEVVRTQLERTRLTAPFAGIIAEINGELNEFVTPSPPGIATLPTFELLDTSCFYVSAPIDEVDAPAVMVNMPARISMDAYGGRHFNGRVRRIAPYVLDREKQARTVEVEVEFSELQEADHFLAGYSADVEIILQERHDALRLPTQALLEGDRVFVYAAEDGRLRQKSIRTGLANWDWTEVLDGLQPGDRVVTSIDLAGLKDGVRAKISEAK